VTDAEIRAYRSLLFGAAYSYQAWLTCQIALGNRESHEGMSRAQARAAVERMAHDARQSARSASSPPGSVTAG